MRANLDLIDRTEAPSIMVPRGGMICLDNVRDMKLRVMRGSVWVTQDGDVEDVSLNAGESFCITRSGRTLVNACEYAPLTLVMLEPPVAIEQKPSERLRRLFARMKTSRRGYAAMFVCIAFAASGCHELGSQSLVLPAKAVGDKVAQGQPGAYFGDVFSEVQKALAALPRSETRSQCRTETETRRAVARSEE